MSEQLLFELGQPGRSEWQRRRQVKREHLIYPAVLRLRRAGYQVYCAGSHNKLKRMHASDFWLLSDQELLDADEEVAGDAQSQGSNRAELFDQTAGGRGSPMR